MNIVKPVAAFLIFCAAMVPLISFLTGRPSLPDFLESQPDNEAQSSTAVDSDRKGRPDINYDLSAADVHNKLQNTSSGAIEQRRFRERTQGQVVQWTVQVVKDNKLYVRIPENQYGAIPIFPTHSDIFYKPVLTASFSKDKAQAFANLLHGDIIKIRGTLDYPGEATNDYQLLDAEVVDVVSRE
ncbi:MAG: hypothetical protein ACREVE_09510 [Gammaproteobacteria bacterium]